MRMTKQRQLILDQLRQRNDHPGADEIYAMVRKHLPKISLGTVYRNLELLTEAGYIERFDFFGLKRFDPVNTPHHHFCCAECGKVEDLPFAIQVPQLEKSHPWVRNRKIEKIWLEYHGLCPECYQKNRA